MTEIIVIHGPPGSGKSVQSERLATEGLPNRAVMHVSAGNRLRGIRTGEIASAYSDKVNPEPGKRVLLDHSIMTGVIFEYINQVSEASIVLVDGYPRFVEAIPCFLETSRRNNHEIVGCVNLNISRRVSLDRVLGRGGREGEVGTSNMTELAEKRFQEHLNYTVPAIDAMGRVTRLVNLDAEESIEKVWRLFYRAIFELAIT